MEQLPEKEERKEDLEAGAAEKTQDRHSGSFTTGFLTGVLTALFFVLVFQIGWGIGERESLKKAVESSEQESEQGAEILTDPTTFALLDEVKNLIEQNYLEETDSELLLEYLLKGVAVGLDDPYANYYTAEELTSVMDSSRGEYTGIGAVISQDVSSGEMTIDEIYPGMPAELAGLQVGDVLLQMDETNLDGMLLNDVVALIKASEETFALKIYRPSEDAELSLEVTCGEVKIQAVTYELYPDGIGYIKLVEFTETAVDQFKEALEVLQEQGMTQLIVDLRDNPGGLLTSVCDILDEVLPEGVLVYTEDKYGNREEYHSDKMRMTDCEMAVLVNENSASASEIFAGAVQDYEAGVIIGTATYGKGIVQKTFPLSNGGAFKMTVEQYYTPLGQDINGNGITPDIFVDNLEKIEENSGKTDENAGETDPVLKKALEVLREAQE